MKKYYLLMSPKKDKYGRQIRPVDLLMLTGVLILVALCLYSCITGEDINPEPLLPPMQTGR